MKVINKKSENTKLLWLDLEAGGLDYEKQPILEIAAIVTEGIFKELESFYALISIDESQIQTMEEGARQMHEKNGLLKRLSEGGSKAEAEKSLLSFIDRYWSKNERVILAGNSVHFDRLYLKKQMPSVGQRLGHRVLDVSAWKTFFQMRFDIEVEKQAPHLAMDDIRLSIKELHFYSQFIDTKALTTWLSQTSS